MSVHLIEMAAELQLPPSLKLGMLCFADSGSAETRIARPGLENLMRWTGLKKSQALKVVRLLEELQLLGKHRSAHRGQRAEYIVFPNGCCERHGKSSAVVLATVEDRDEKGSATADAFLSTGSAGPDPIAANGSDAGDGMGPISGPEWVRRSRSEVEPSKYLPPKATSPGSPEPAQPTTGYPQVASIDLSDASRRPVGRQPQPGFALGCRHCDAGWICDGDGLPISKCLHCHPAHRSNGASA